MTTAALKKEIKKVIENMDDNRVLEAVYVLLSNNVQNHHHYQLSDDDISIIEERDAAYESGKVKTYTVAEVKRKILKNHGK